MKTKKQKCVNSKSNLNPRSTEATARQVLRSYYESTRRNDKHEPSWIHPNFVEVYSGAALDRVQVDLAQTIAEGKVVRSNWFGQWLVVDRDGWTVGTATWIFLRRRLCKPLTYKGWTIISAAFEGETYWMAYSSGTTFDAIGTTMSLDQMVAAVDRIEGQRNTGDKNRTTASVTNPASKPTYYTLVVLMRRDAPVIVGFQSDTNARTLPVYQMEKFFAFVLQRLGISPDDMADLGNAPCNMMTAFDHPHEAVAHLDWLFGEFGPNVPGDTVLARFAAHAGG